MSNKTLTNVKIQLRNDTKNNWSTTNPVLSKGEMGVEIDTGKFKIGDGVKDWKTLGYNGVVVTKSSINGNIIVDGGEVTVYTLPIANASVLGGVKSSSGQGKITVASDGTMSVGSVATAGKLTTPRTISLTGKVTGSASFDGSSNVAISTTVTGLGSAASKDVGTSSGQVPVLGSDGKLDTAIIPALAIGEVSVVDSQQAMLALTAQQGDTAVRTDVKKTFILKQSPSSNIENWVEILTPTSAGFVSTVNGKTGVVTLTTSDITEGSNLYYTEARATNNFNSNIAKTVASKLQDGANILMKTDTLTLDCGNA